MTTTMVQEGDLLYVDRTIHGVAQFPDGLAVLVQEVLGWADHPHAVWVRGAVVDRRVTNGHLLVLSLPVSDSRPVPMSRSPRQTTAALAGTGDETGLVGPPPGYARRIFGLAEP